MRLTTLLDSYPAEAGELPITTSVPERTARVGAAVESAQQQSVPTVAPSHSGGRNVEFDLMLEGLLPCRTEDPELWFAERSADVERAKALCQECPLQAGCLQGALDRAEPWGVWGGEIFVDGRVVAIKRGRGRPRKIQD